MLNFKNRYTNISKLFPLIKEETVNYNHIILPSYKSIEPVWNFNK